ncbi:MAG: hypothetical protein AAGG11_14030, partial [Pseudomonadota bacterium]
MGADNLIGLLIGGSIVLLSGMAVFALWTDLRRSRQSEALLREQLNYRDLVKRSDHQRFGIADLERRIAAKTSDNALLRTELRVQKQVYAELNERLITLRTDGLALKRKQTRFEADIERLQEAIADWKQRLATLQDGIDSRARNAFELERELDAGLAAIDDELHRSLQREESLQR